MESNSKFQQWFTSAMDWLNEQEWFQQIRGKWDELDAQSRFYAKIGAASLAAALAGFMLISSWLSVRALKNDVLEKQELSTMIEGSYNELKRLKDENSELAPAGESDSSPWQAYFENQAVGAGVDKANLTVGGEKPGDGSNLAKEGLYEIGLKKVNIRQLVKLAFQLENGPRPVKLRNIAIDTKADPNGIMDATFQVSAFTITPSTGTPGGK